MSNFFNAHIFKHRSRGEREEVKMKLFYPDGSPVDLSGGGNSSSGATSYNDSIEAIEGTPGEWVSAPTPDLVTVTVGESRTLAVRARVLQGYFGPEPGEENEFTPRMAYYLDGDFLPTLENTNPQTPEEAASTSSQGEIAATLEEVEDEAYVWSSAHTASKYDAGWDGCGQGSRERLGTGHGGGSCLGPHDVLYIQLPPGEHTIEIVYKNGSSGQIVVCDRLLNAWRTP